MTNDSLQHLQGVFWIPDFSKHCPSLQSNQNLSAISTSKNLDFSLLNDVHFLANLSLYAKYKEETAVTLFLTIMPQIKETLLDE